jgi:Helix-turn-helix domain of resolvase
VLYVDRDEALSALYDWKVSATATAQRRDEVVADAHRAGLTITEINEITGLSRTTIYKILGIARGAT